MAIPSVRLLILLRKQMTEEVPIMSIIQEKHGGYPITMICVSMYQSLDLIRL